MWCVDPRRRPTQTIYIRDTGLLHHQAYFWRTHAGAEIDLLLDRGNRRIALEIKAGSGRSAYLARGLAAAAADAKAHASWIVDQAQGEQTYRNRVRCRNFVEDLDWLPR